MPKLAKAIKVVSIAASFLVPAVVFAQSEVQNGLSGIGASFPHTGIASATQLTGPLGLIALIIRYLLTISGAIAVVFVIIGGFWYITSAGNAEQAEKGQKTLTNAIIGVVVVILSYVIINVVVNFATGGGGFFG